MFRQDADHSSLRELLPFDNLRLLLADSVPVLVIIAVASAIAMGVLGASPETRILGGLLCLLLGGIVVLCGGLERFRILRMRAPIGYGISASISACLVLYAGAVGSLASACATAFVVAAALCLMVRFSRR